MSQQSSLNKSKSTWGKFSTEQSAIATQSKLTEAGIDPEQVTLETEDYFKRRW